MTPVLLDQKGIFKAGTIVALVITVVFVSGYYIGYQRAESGKGVDLNRTMVLALPKPAHADESNYEPLTPKVQMPGSDIDVDSPEIPVATVIEQTTDAIEAPVNGDSRADSNGLELAAVTEDSVDSAGIVAHGGPTSSDTTKQAGQSALADTASAEEARYTIQVGVFADSENAMRRQAELESRQLTAYIKEYRNKQDQARFNVRFGYFKDKSSANAALNSFEQRLSGSGYVTRIRRN